MSSLQTQDIVLRSATTTPPPQARSHVPQVAKLIDISSCIGCKACQVACMEWNDLRDEVGTNHGVYDNPMDLTAESWTVMRFFEVENEKEEGSLEWLIRKDGCMHCEDPGCLKSCPTGALQFGTKEEMIEYAEERIVDLKDRGYDNAGLYDPAGVSGTHVMYVLKHADKPELTGLPRNPTISPMVKFWKGAAKPIALAAVGVAALAGFFHYVKRGPLEVPEDEDKDLLASQAAHAASQPASNDHPSDTPKA